MFGHPPVLTFEHLPPVRKVELGTRKHTDTLTCAGQEREKRPSPAALQ